jgi:hypothetical protein
MRRDDALERRFLSICYGKASPDDRGWALNKRFEERLRRVCEYGKRENYQNNIYMLNSNQVKGRPPLYSTRSVPINRWTT